MTAPSLAHRVFAPVDPGGGAVSRETIFNYNEDAGVVSATYGGGRIRGGFLIGVRTEDTLDFRYAQLHDDGTTACGHCSTEIEVLPDGRLRLNESWSWESRDGSGESVLEEVDGPEEPNGLESAGSEQAFGGANSV
jgi:hypothetical protein